MPPKLIDLEKMVKDWAWIQYGRTANKKQRRLREKELRKGTPYIGVRIDWSGVKFKDETQWPRLAEAVFTEKDVGAQKQTTDLSLKPVSSKSHSSILFQTKYHNNTDDDQEYTLKTEKTTTSTCETVVEHSFTKGIEMSVSLKTPCEVLEASAGYSQEETLTNSVGQSFEEELTWAVESQIKVKANHMAEAQLVVTEKKCSGEFVVKTQIWGHVFVSFTNLRENNAEFKATGHDIFHVFKDFLDVERRTGHVYDFVELNEEDSVVTVSTKGSCNFRFGIQQEVTVNQKEINSPKQ